MNKIRIRLAIVPLALLFFLSVPGLFVSNAENAISLNKKGWDAYNRTEYDRAIFSFINSLRINARYSDSLIGAGKSYYALGVYDKALDMFLDALRLDSKSVDALNGTGMVLTDTGRFTEAIGYFEKSYAISGDNLDSQYGLAYVYYRMGRTVWAKRKVQNIFRSNPYHYQALLLMADIKIDDGRLGEAREYVAKAIDSKNDMPAGYIKYGDILLKNYLRTGDRGSIAEAVESYNRALSINPDNYEANRNMGMIFLMEASDMNSEKAAGGSFNNAEYNEKCTAAINYLSKAAAVTTNRSTLYSLSLAYELSGDKNRALEYMLQSYTKFPSDALLRGKIEDFLILNDYKSAHPARVMLSNENIELSRLNKRESLHADSMYYLRRALFLNPQNRDVREQLISYYSILDYNELMIGEMKNQLQHYPDYRTQDALNLAIVKRRNRLYSREGYATDDVPRNVPRVIVLNFDSAGKLADHPDAGRVVARNLSFAIQQFGRMRVVGIRERESVAGDLKSGGDALFDSIRKLKDYRDEKGEAIDFVVFGEVYEVDDYLHVKCRLMDMNKGYIISEFEVSARGRENLGSVSLKTAVRLYETIPYSGKILKLKDDGIVVNLGLIDGVKAGSRLVIYMSSRSRATGDMVRYAEIFTVKESDTFICYAEPDSSGALKEVDSTFVVYPLQQRRAKKMG
ncbi:MAG TPA: tetratricopeptide repeat protein [Spirochaetota bacterium]|nr:tetratricopeptide repeat protein [Spirochaetota bacterium]HQO39291.1 tetratricopeptide repeat protein [Spirochaetota bacterium]